MSMFDIALDYQRERERFPKLRHLDYRELSMARMLAAGASGREAGLKLGLNADAAEAVRRELLRKLGVGSEAELAPLVGTSGPGVELPEVAYVDDFRVSYFRPTTGSHGDVVFVD
jgi:DNA-binding NarL/FixJ family response regulator